jgi:hypothetical protein
MKTNIKFIVSALGVGVAVLFLPGCHHFGGGCAYMSTRAPASVPANTSDNSSTPTPAQANAPAAHQH